MIVIHLLRFPCICHLLTEEWRKKESRFRIVLIEVTEQIHCQFLLKTMCKMTHTIDFRFWVSVCVASGDQVERDKGQWNSESANSLHFTPQVSLTSLNTLLRLSRSLHCTLLNSDFSGLSLQRNAVRDYHILKKILPPQVLH